MQSGGKDIVGVMFTDAQVDSESQSGRGTAVRLFVEFFIWPETGRADMTLDGCAAL